MHFFIVRFIDLLSIAPDATIKYRILQLTITQNSDQVTEPSWLPPSGLLELGQISLPAAGTWCLIKAETSVGRAHANAKMSTQVFLNKQSINAIVFWSSRFTCLPACLCRIFSLQCNWCGLPACVSTLALGNWTLLGRVGRAPARFV